MLRVRLSQILPALVRREFTDGFPVLQNRFPVIRSWPRLVAEEFKGLIEGEDFEVRWQKCFVLCWCHVSPCWKMAGGFLPRRVHLLHCLLELLSQTPELPVNPEILVD